MRSSKGGFQKSGLLTDRLPISSRSFGINKMYTKLSQTYNNLYESLGYKKQRIIEIITELSFGYALGFELITVLIGLFMTYVVLTDLLPTFMCEIDDVTQCFEIVKHSVIHISFITLFSFVGVGLIVLSGISMCESIKDFVEIYKESEHI